MEISRNLRVSEGRSRADHFRIRKLLADRQEPGKIEDDFQSDLCTTFFLVLLHLAISLALSISLARHQDSREELFLKVRADPLKMGQPHLNAEKRSAS